MHDVLFTTHGIHLLIEKLDLSKAPGPNQLSTNHVQKIATVLKLFILNH